jgi:biotin operon repressor
MRIYFTGIILIWLACLFMACTTSDLNKKAIWAYEQSLHGEAPFRFYPDTFVTVGAITVKDSLDMMRQALNNRSVDSLMKENDATLNNLLGLQNIDLRYDLELSREEVSKDIDQLQNVGKWLNNYKIQRDIYLKMPPEMLLVREVECRFSFDDSIAGGKMKQDKIYYIDDATNRVVASREITPYETHQTH